MPQSITIALPLVIEGEVGTWLVRPVGFPEFSFAASNVEGAIRNAKRRVAKLCAKYVGVELIARLVRGEVRQSEVTIEFQPPKKSEQWREPLSVNFASFAWSQDDSLVVTYVPRLDLTIVASPGTDVATLVQEQIRSAVRRMDDWSLKQLVQYDRGVATQIQSERLQIELQTPAEMSRQTSDQPESKTPTLHAVATRLKRKSLPRAYHRDDLVELLAQLLSGDQARSVLLVGPSGVGKTAIFHQWVRSRDRWDMKHVKCWATDGSRLISGQCGFGMWQQQCLAMADEAAKYPSVIHLGNLVELSESGRNRGSGGCGSLLAPRLADGSLIGVIECTAEQLTRMQRIEPRLVASLTKLTIEEPTSEENRSILLEAATAWRPVDISADLKRRRREKKKRTEDRLNRHWRASSKSSERRRKKSSPSPAPLPIVQPEALQVLDRLHRRFKTDAAAPGRPLAFFESVMSEMRPGETLDLGKVHAAFGRQTGLPSFLIDDDVRPDLEQVQQQLQSQVLGQDEVITTLVDVIATMAADLSRGDRPLASLMMIGPTGVGKTETAKALARLIYSDVSRLVRIDMSELSSPTAVGRLIGDSVHAEGLLTSAVRAQPFSLVLLDEFEKAHASVFDLLLQVLGEGRLTDGRGRVADFRNSIVMMTSNLGVESFRANPMGLADTNQEFRYRNHFEKQVREFLRPEMFNRIDRILSYAPLSPQTVRQIAELQLDSVQLLDGWKHQGSGFEVESGVTDLLAKRGYEPQFGARPLNREIQKSVLVPMANAVCDIGRQHRVDVTLQVAGEDENESRIAVTAKVAPLKSRRQRDQVTRLIDEITLLRRRGQALEGCRALTKLRNRYTTSRRSLRRKIANAKNRNEKDAIRFSVRASHCNELRNRIRAVEKLSRDLRRAESRLLCSIHANESIDVAAQDASVANLKDRLWETLCELQSQREIANQHISLILLGPRLDLAQSLLEGYREIAKNRSWNLQVHALLPRDNDGKTDRVIDEDGWSSEPLFRVATESCDTDVEEHLRSIGGETKDLVIASASERATGSVGSTRNVEVEKGALAAYGLINLSRLAYLPNGALAVLLTFGGRAAEMLMAGEVGVHTFNGLDQKTSLQHSVLINKHLGTPIQYKAPVWLSSRKFEMSGHPRRGYDINKGMVLELTNDDARSMKMDREGQWLEQVLEQEMERRIWATLETDEPD